MMEEYYERYRGIGFMCGLEIHQRLATAEKLFCSCPTNIIELKGGEPRTVSRYQRAVAGELGAVDRSAEFEEQRRRRFTYRIDGQRSCLVEIDEEPPHGMNHDALLSAISFASAMSMKVIEEIQPMRKEVVDGSDPSAFQRTAMVAFDGFIEVNGGRVSIPSMFVEEESGGIAGSSKGEITYSVERLGVPLVEIDTDPHIRSPRDAKDIALYIGTMLRISGRVQRGIGSIRQDVNVSIKGGARVEIKGFQEIDSVDKLIDNEVRRQEELLRIRDELKRRKASVMEPMYVTDVFMHTAANVVKSQLEGHGVVVGLRLKGFAGLLGAEINPKRRLGTEVSDYAKAAGVKGIIHGDEDLDGYGFSKDEISGLSKKLGMNVGDSFIIVAGMPEEAVKAAMLAKQRAEQAIVGVPPETRGAATDGTFTTRFLRPLPGGSRMYPETDAKPIPVSDKMLRAARASAPDVEKERSVLAKQVGGDALAARLMLSQRLQVYRALVGDTKADPKFIANVLLQKFTELKRDGIDVNSIGDARLIEMFELYSKGRITKQAVDEILRRLAKEDIGVKEVVRDGNLGRISGKKLEKLVNDARKAGASGKEALRDRIMEKHRLNVDGGELNSLL